MRDLAPDPVSRCGDAIPDRPSLGQGTFRVLDAFGRRCAVTHERTLPVLQTAHIRPCGEGGQRDVANGLLLRSDIHLLFDQGYVTVTPEHRFEVSRRIREEFENGRDYYALHGSQVELPHAPFAPPDPDLLQWHNESLFGVSARHRQPCGAGLLPAGEAGSSPEARANR